MKIYLVGGAVRDQLLQRPVHERDWVVVGGTAQEMLAQGYKQVGRDFPVFLHPRTHEEYALARTERKTGKGYTGFVVHADPAVTLEQDLLRRDLTINAIAQDEAGKLIDPYGGLQDLQDKYLRHVSPAFSEDPVRILRVARFAARFADFAVHPSTIQLMKKMVSSGEIDALVPERVWQELSRALTEAAPARFFETLQQCEAFEKLFPAEFDLDALKQCVSHSSEAVIRYAALTHKLSSVQLTALNTRYKIPHEFADLARLVASEANNILTLGTVPGSREPLRERSPANVLAIFMRCDALRRPERFEKILTTLQAFHPSGVALTPWYKLLSIVLAVNPQPFVAQGFSGKAMAEKLLQAREQAIADFFRKNA